MKHLEKFEKFDYLSALKFQKNIDNQFQDHKDAENKSNSNGSNYLTKISSEAKEKAKKEKALEERKELTHIVLQSIIYCEQNKEGFSDFKDELNALLNKYPLDKLPKTGTKIYK